MTTRQSSSNRDSKSRSDKNKPRFVVRAPEQSVPIRENYKCALLIIDPQNDFVSKKGSLRITGADDDCKRIRDMIFKHNSEIDQIFVTLDTHQQMHIAHPLFWKDSEGKSPEPFTVIDIDDIVPGYRAGRTQDENDTPKYSPRIPQLKAWAIDYVSALERLKKPPLTIWPNHCLVGTKGHNVYKPLRKALEFWEKSNAKTVSYIIKGTNALTEHYSCFKAEVTLIDDVSTHLNKALINELAKYENIVIGGEALSHCVNWSVRDFVDNLSDDNNRPNIYVLQNGSTPIDRHDYIVGEFKSYMESKDITFASIEAVTSEIFS